MRDSKCGCRCSVNEIADADGGVWQAGRREWKCETRLRCLVYRLLVLFGLPERGNYQRMPTLRPLLTKQRSFFSRQSNNRVNCSEVVLDFFRPAACLTGLESACRTEIPALQMWHSLPVGIVVVSNGVDVLRPVRSASCIDDRCVCEVSRCSLRPLRSAKTKSPETSDLETLTGVASSARTGLFVACSSDPTALLDLYPRRFREEARMPP